MTLSKLSREEVNLIKGVGILLIVLHNFFHNLPPILGENEFVFFSQIISKYSNELANEPQRAVTLVFSLWGHYGVELFIFVSVYGSTLSYSKKSKTYNKFISEKFKGLYFSFLVCVVAYIILGLVKETLSGDKVIFFDEILWKLLLISNFIPGQTLTPVGPWWFIPFIFQLYLILPLLIWLKTKFTVKIIYLVGLSGGIVELLFLGELPQLNASPFGHLPLICLAIILVGFKQIKISRTIILISVLLFFASQYIYPIWLISDLIITLLLITLTSKLLFQLTTDNYLYRFFSFYGTLSLHLFLVNGFLRSPFKSLSSSLDSWYGEIAAAILSLLFSTIFALCLKWIENRLRLQINIT
tara:strand:+ start:3753 stop:4820 length:1068 start_codon:yes stop_codon:yes gene_type:complete